MQLRVSGVTALALGTGLVLPGHAVAQSIEVSVAIPQLKVAEYHRPYVAIWLEKAGSPATTLAVWYDNDKAANEGTKWLRDVRQWWRASGRSLKFPNGLSGATKAPGSHRATFTAGRGALTALPAGQYTLVVEAAREVGGRELLKLPFTWTGSGTATARAQGSSELGLVTVTVKR